MAKKQAAKAAEDDGILDILGLAGEPEPKKETKEPAKGEPSTEDRISALLGTIEGLSGRVEQMQGDFMRLATGSPTPIQVPEAPKLQDVTFDGLPDQTEDPEGFAKGVNTRVTATLQANMAALTAHQAATQAAAVQVTNRGDQLWADFQASYSEKLEAGLPDTIKDVDPYVETAAKAVAARAVRGMADPAQKQRALDSYMYGTPQRFMEDVFAEVDKVLAPLRVKSGEGEGEAKGEGDAGHRTAGITGAGGSIGGKKTEAEEAGTLVGDIEAVQRATGFF